MKGVVTLPRKAPDGNGVIEHRITLGNYERQQLKESVDAYQKAAILRNIGGAALPAAGLLAAIGIGYGAYSFWVWVSGNPQIPGIYNMFGIADRWKDVNKTVDDKHAAKMDRLDKKIAQIDALLANADWGTTNQRAQAQTARANFVAARAAEEKRYAKEKEILENPGAFSGNPIDEFLGNLLLGR